MNEKAKFANQFASLMHDFDWYEYIREHEPILAHYTSIKNIESILKSGEFWFSNPLAMNDYEELRFGLIEGAALFRTLPAVCGQFCSEETLRALNREFDANLAALDQQVHDIYVFCFSEHDPNNRDGKLSMWRGYGAQGSGAALLLSTQLLAVPDDNHPLILTKVRYGSREGRRALLRDKLVNWALQCRELEVEPKHSDELALFAFRAILMFSLSWNHDGFSEENEWRVIYYPPYDPNGLLRNSVGYAITPDGIVPKLRFKVAPLPGTSNQGIDFDKLVSGILLGPAASSTLAVSSVKRMLMELGRPNLVDRVSASSIPFRAKSG